MGPGLQGGGGVRPVPTLFMSDCKGSTVAMRLVQESTGEFVASW